MPSKTKLAKRVLVRIGVIDADENPTAKEAQDVIEVMDSKYQSLKERGFFTFPLENIPKRYQNPFIDVVADAVSPDFDLESPTLNGRAQIGLREIYAMSSRRINSQEEPPVDF